MNAHFNAYKARYAFLDQEFKPIFSVNKINHVNLFINLDDVFHNIHRPLINNEFLVYGEDASKQLMANILNLIAHYRGWILRQRKTCKVFAIYTGSRRRFKNTIFIPEYRKHFIDINENMNTQFFYINKAIREAMPLLSVFSNYIEGIYIIDSSYLEPSMIPLMISDFLSIADWNILITRDTYDYQYSYMGRWSIVYAKSGQYETTSMITVDNVWDKIKEKNKIELDTHKYDASLLPFALALTGDKYRGIKSPKRIGWKTFFNMVEDVYDEEESDTLNTDSIEVSICDKLFLKSKDKTVATNLTNNIQAISIKTQFNNLGDIDKMMIREQIRDIPDIDNLQKMNKIYFTKYPININNLTKKVYTPDRTKVNWNV